MDGITQPNFEDIQQGDTAPAPLPSQIKWPIAEQRLTLVELFNMSVSRSGRWHHGNMAEWSTLEWAGAMTGECGEVADAVINLLMTYTQMAKHAGEAANAAKKLRRVELDMSNINTERDRQLYDLETARRVVLKEVSDTILYGMLVAAMCTRNAGEFEAVLRSTFNKKSEEYGFPERI